jgi:hypothetical protein
MREISQEEYDQWAEGAAERIVRRQARNARTARRQGTWWGKALHAAHEAVTGGDGQTLNGVPVTLSGQTLTYRGEDRPVRGVVATVETAQSVHHRPTLTWFVDFGVLPVLPAITALVVPKRTVEQELYLTITGPDFQRCVPASQGRGARVRALAAEINTAARRVTAS